MLACKDVVQLSASDALQTAPHLRRMAVRMHLLMCEHCRRYVRELTMIRTTGRSRAAAEQRDTSTDAAFEARVLEAMRKTRES